MNGLSLKNINYNYLLHQKQIKSEIECADTNMLDGFLDDFLENCIKLSWTLTTCVPPMIASCNEKRYDRKIHSRVSAKTRSTDHDEHTLEYRSPILYTNYIGHVKAKGKVEIIPVSETNQPFQSETGPGMLKLILYSL